MDVNEHDMAPPAERLVYLDYLRVFAVIAVIVIHICALLWYTISVYSYYWQAFTIYGCLVRWAVPVFFMISGTLFLDPARTVSARDMLRRRCARIVCAFLFWSAAYTLFHGLSHGFGFDILDSLLSGEYHMWFLYAIAGLYIATPLLRRITASASMTRYFLLLSLIFTFALPWLADICGVLDVWPPVQGLVDTLNGMAGQLSLHITLGYAAFYVLGYYLSQCTLTRRRVLVLAALGIAGTAAVYFLTTTVSRRQGSANELFYDISSVPVLLQSVAVFAVGKYLLTRRSTHRPDKLMQKLSGYTFGIYLVHVMIIDALNLMGMNTISFNPYLTIPVMTAITFVVSAVISALLNHIPFLRGTIV